MAERLDQKPAIASIDGDYIFLACTANGQMRRFSKDVLEEFIIDKAPSSGAGLLFDDDFTND